MIDPNAPVHPMLEPSSIEGLYSLRDCGITIRTQACIDLRVPKTGEPWLDDLIREARRHDDAAMAMAAIISHQQDGTCEMTDRDSLASCAVECADALIAELNKEPEL